MQFDLLGIDTVIRGNDFDGLPLINHAGSQDIEVQVPGHTYAPVLIEHASGKLDIGPAPLIASERQFVVDLVKHLCPNDIFPKHTSTPIIADGIEFYLRRNLPNNDGSARFRIDSENWFYPDFVLWIIDRRKNEQIIAFVDPKGLRTLEGGWKNHKLLCSLYSVNEAQVALELGNQTIKDEKGKIFSVRMASAIVSTTRYQDLEKSTQFNLGEQRIPTVEEFNAAGIWFPDKQPDYISLMINSLCKTSRLTEAMLFAASTWSGKASSPKTEEEFYLAALIAEAESDDKSPILDVFLRNTLGGGAIAAESCKYQLYERAKGKILSMGFKQVQNDLTPCKSWYEWLMANGAKSGNTSSKLEKSTVHANASDING